MAAVGKKVYIYIDSGNVQEASKACTKITKKKRVIQTATLTEAAIDIHS